MENETQVDISFVDAAKEIWASVHPDEPYDDDTIAQMAENLEAVYPQCTVEMPIVEFGKLTDNARALFVTPLSTDNPIQTFTVFYPDVGRFMFVHTESGMPVEMSSAECLNIPTQYLTAVIGAEQMLFVEGALTGNIEPNDPVAEQMRLMVEAQREQATHDDELKHIALNTEPALHGSHMPGEAGVDNPPDDYISFEQYLEVMRKMHSYEQMPSDHRVQFDHACAYRWRDIKALKLILASVEGNDGTSALGRYNAELVRLSMVNDQTYLELTHLRNMMREEAKVFRELAKSQAKKNKLAAQSMGVFADRIDNCLELLGPLPDDAVDMLTRLNKILDLKTEEAAKNLNGVIILSTEVERLRNVLQQEADYCYNHANALAESDPERAARHRERGNRLALQLNPPVPVPEPEESLAEDIPVSGADIEDVTTINE